MSRKRFIRDSLEHHQASARFDIDDIKNSFIEAVTGVPVVLTGAGVEIFSVAERSPLWAVLGGAALVLGGGMIKDGYDSIVSDVEALTQETATVTKLQAELAEQEA